MPNPIIQENLQMIQESLDLIFRRFSQITSPDDFILNDNGVLILDSIVMRLQIVGESLKKIHKEDDSFLVQYSEVNWDNIMRLRDLVSHHYEKVDHEIIFDICKNHLSDLGKVIKKMRLRNNNS